MTLEMNDIVHPNLLQVCLLLDKVIRLERPKIRNGHFWLTQRLEYGTKFGTNSFSGPLLKVLDCF